MTIVLTGSGSSIRLSSEGQAIHLSGGARSITLQRAGIRGLPGQPGEVPDEAWTQVDAPILDLFSGEPAVLGEEGFSFIRWTRIGRTVFARWYWRWDPAHGAQPIGFPAVMLAATDLPPPRLPPPGFGVPGGFGYANAQPFEDDEGQLRTGFFVSAPPAISDIAGDGQAIALLMVVAAEVLAGGIENIFSSSNPVVWDDRAVNYQGAIEYEPADAAEDDEP